jgi:hypothetical protein
MNMEKPAKPQLLNKLTILMGFLNPLGYLFLTGNEKARSIEIVIFSFIIIFSYWVLFKFQKGFNWARILVMITSGVAVFNLLFLMNYGLFLQVVIVIEAFLGIYLLYWLNTNLIKAYFIANSDV